MDACAEEGCEASTCEVCVGFDGRAIVVDVTLVNVVYASESPVGVAGADIDAEETGRLESATLAGALDDAEESVEFRSSPRLLDNIPTRDCSAASRASMSSCSCDFDMD